MGKYRCPPTLIDNTTSEIIDGMNEWAEENELPNDWAYSFDEIDIIYEAYDIAHGNDN